MNTIPPIPQTFQAVPAGFDPHEAAHTWAQPYAAGHEEQEDEP